MRRFRAIMVMTLGAEVPGLGGVDKLQSIPGSGEIDHAEESL